MEPAELQNLLRAGIQAIRRGDRARGRELLLQVVQADDRNEPAWLWLSQAMDDPNDQIVALENALTINPANAPARAKLREVQAQLGLLPPEPPPAPPPQPEPPPAPRPELFTPVDPDDDPWQCPYCGRPALETDEKCAHCQQSLTTTEGWDARPHTSNLVIVFGIDLVINVLLGIAPIFAGPLFNRILQADPATTHPIGNAFAQTLREMQRIGIFNLFLTGPVAAQVLRAAALLAAFGAAYSDMDLAFAGAIAFALADILWSASGFALGIVGGATAGVNVLAALIVVLLSVNALAARHNARRRMRVELDRNTVGAMGFWQRGQEYARRGMWALAAKHWVLAVAHKPTQGSFYMDLGRALMQLERYEKALRALEEGARHAPGEADFPRLIRAARERRKPAE